jgi:hypothetical protein
MAISEDSKQKMFILMAKLNPTFKKREVLNEDEDKWIQGAVNPEHKGYCTPMTKPTCTPARKALAKRFKKGVENETYGTPDPLGKSMAKPIQEEIGLKEATGPDSPIHAWVMFGYNFSPDFIEQVWQNEQNMVQHLKPKFDSFYKQYGADAVMNRFYAELDGSNQKKLEDWVLAKQISEEELGGEQQPVDMQQPSEKFRAEVTGKGENVWSTNAMEYNTEEEAKKWLDGLSGRWFGYDMGRVVPVSTPKGQPVDIKNDIIYQNFRR